MTGVGRRACEWLPVPSSPQLPITFPGNLWVETWPVPYPITAEAQPSEQEQCHPGMASSVWLRHRAAASQHMPPTRTNGQLHWLTYWLGDLARLSECPQGLEPCTPLSGSFQRDGLSLPFQPAPFLPGSLWPSTAPRQLERPTFSRVCFCHPPTRSPQSHSLTHSLCPGCHVLWKPAVRPRSSDLPLHQPR